MNIYYTIRDLPDASGPSGPTGPTGSVEIEPTVGFVPPPVDMSGSPIFEWIIPHIDIGSYDELKNVILYIHWRYRATAVDTNNNIYTTETYNVLILPPPNTDIFIPLENITKEMMINWLESMIDVQTMQYELITELQNKIHANI